VCAGLQSHPTYATGEAALDVMAYAKAARRFNVPMIIVNVRNAAEFTVARMAGKSQGHTLPPNWPTTKMGGRLRITNKAPLPTKSDMPTQKTFTVPGAYQRTVTLSPVNWACAWCGVLRSEQGYPGS
jgi:hypothetical protein